MALLTVLKEPDSRLRLISKPVDKITSEIIQLLNDMMETMLHEEGMGLAAPQVNIQKRIFVLECPLYDPVEETRPSEKNLEYLVLKVINPVIIKKSDEMVAIKEGCLSVPDEPVSVQRSRLITVRYLNELGEDKILEADGLLSICIQHEIDHLDGKLIIDALSPFKKQVVLKRLKKRKDEEN